MAWSGALDDRHGQVPDLARVVGLHDVLILDIDGDPCRTARALVHDDPMAPRIPPLPAEGRDPKTAELLDGLKGFNGTELNIFATLAHHPRLLKRWSAFGGMLLYGGALPARERELLILRSGYLCQAPYEWGQHVTIGLASGLTDDEVARVAEGPTPTVGRTTTLSSSAPPTSSTPTAASAMPPGLPSRRGGTPSSSSRCAWWSASTTSWR